MPSSLVVPVLMHKAGLLFSRGLGTSVLQLVDYQDAGFFAFGPPGSTSLLSFFCAPRVSYVSLPGYLHICLPCRLEP